MKGLPKVSLIIPTHNGKDLIEKFMPSIMALSYSNIEVIVVDDNSSDGTIKYLTKKYSSVRVLSKPLATSTGKSKFGLIACSFWNENNNLGIKYCTGDYIWLLNNDVEVESDSLGQLVDFMESRPDVGICSPLIYYYGDKLMLQSAGNSFSKLGFHSNVGVGLRNVRLTSPYEITYASGAAIFIRRETCEALNGLDEEVLTGGDDIDFSLRCWIEGFKIMLVPKAKVYHVVGASVNKVKFRTLFNEIGGTIQTILRNLESKTIFVAMPGFLSYSLLFCSYNMIKKRNVQYLLAFFSSVIFNLKNIQRTLIQRKIIQKKRKVRDNRFLSLTQRNFNLARNRT
jgi:GT2 family glycosyltransferase